MARRDEHLDAHHAHGAHRSGLPHRHGRRDAGHGPHGPRAHPAHFRFAAHRRRRDSRSAHRRALQAPRSRRQGPHRQARLLMVQSRMAPVAGLRGVDRVRQLCQVHVLPHLRPRLAGRLRHDGLHRRAGAHLRRHEHLPRRLHARHPRSRQPHRLHAACAAGLRLCLLSRSRDVEDHPRADVPLVPYSLLRPALPPHEPHSSYGRHAHDAPNARDAVLLVALGCQCHRRRLRLDRCDMRAYVPRE